MKGITQTKGYFMRSLSDLSDDWKYSFWGSFSLLITTLLFLIFGIYNLYFNPNNFLDFMQSISFDKTIYYTLFVCFIIFIILLLLLFLKTFKLFDKFLVLLGYEHGYHISFLALWGLLGFLMLLLIHQPYHIETGKTSKEIYYKISQSLLNPLYLGGFVGVVILAIRSRMAWHRLGEEKRLKDLQRIIKKMENHAILFGYGNLGKQTIKEIVQSHQKIDELKPLKLWWDENEQITVSQNLLIVEKNEKNIDFIAGPHPLTGKIGFIRATMNKQRFNIPVVIGDIRSEAVQKIVKLDKAATVTSTSLHFESNLKLVEALKSLESANGVRPKSVIPCEWHAEREILDKMLISPYKDEILHVIEHSGFVTAGLVKNKLPRIEKDLDKSKNDETKILICGNLDLYYVIEGLLLHRAISLPSRTPEGIQLLENIVIFDEKFPEDQFYPVNSFEEVRSILREESRYNINSFTKRMFREICHRGNVGLWRPAFSLMHPYLVDQFSNAVCAIPVIKESYYMYLLSFMKFYRPDLVIILFPQAEKTYKTLKLLNWGKRWWIDSQDNNHSPYQNTYQYKQPQIVVNVTDESFLNDIRNFMYNCFGQIYGIYSPIAGLSQELALLKRMVSEMS